MPPIPAPRRDGRTLRQAVDAAPGNSLNGIRLVLAVAVIVSHAWPLNGHRGEPQLGSSAVLGFFAISGFLIAESRSRTSLWRFLVRRASRIWPAFLVMLLVVAFLLAPLTVLVAGESGWHLADAVRFVSGNAALYSGLPDIAGTVEDVPYPGVWNGAMWTLFDEFGCYLGLGLLMTICTGRRLTIGLVMVLVAVTVLAVAVDLGATVPAIVATGARPVASFVAGALLWTVADRVLLSDRGAALAAGVVVVGVALRIDALVAPLAVAYLLQWAGLRLPGRHIGARNDVSYGVYLYGFPVQQVLAHWLHGPHVPIWAAATIAVFLTLPIAWASWLLVERPMQRLGRRLTARRASERQEQVGQCGRVLGGDDGVLLRGPPRPLAREHGAVAGDRPALADDVVALEPQPEHGERR